MDIKLYEVDPEYIDYLGAYAVHIFQNKKPEQRNNRKYIGVVLHVNDMDYFAPLSSYKPKHKKMSESLDFLKIGTYAVINLNNMFPVKDGLYSYVNIAEEKDLQYRKLLLSEYRIIRKRQDRIRKNAAELYKQKNAGGNNTALLKRCNDFKMLEEKCKEYHIV